MFPFKNILNAPALKVQKNNLRNSCPVLAPAVVYINKTKNNEIE